MRICSMPGCQTTSGCQCDNQFRPNWKLSPTESMAVKLTIALHRHIPNWPGATALQAQAFVRDPPKENYDADS